MTLLSMTCMRFAIFFFNLVFVIFGLLAIVYGSIIINESKTIGDGIVSINHGAPLTAVIVGVFVTLISSFGCFGALKENNCCLMFYSAIVFLLLIIELTIGGLLYSHRNHLENYTGNVIKAAIDNVINTNNTRVYNDLQDLQRSMKCCGGIDFHDWAHFTTNITELPPSCCPPSDNSTANFNCTEQEAYHVGCSFALKEKLGPFFSVLATVSILMAIFQLFACVVSCLLIGHNKNSYEYMIS